MKCCYDMHIHSVLSPCADRDMTPNNIVNMACIKGLSIIAVTDHNAVLNYPAVKKVASELGIEAVPGMEVTTKEEVHVLCYFRNYEDALNVGTQVYNSLGDIRNNPALFGEQSICDENDTIIGTLDRLLISNASNYSVESLYDLVKENRGAIVPAHVNKMADGILGVLGFIPLDLNIDYVEVYPKGEYNPKLIKKYGVFRNSDAHQLIDISEAVNCLELDSPSAIYEYLNIP